MNKCKMIGKRHSTDRCDCREKSEAVYERVKLLERTRL